MNEPQHNPRTPSVEVDCIFTDRWSPRAFNTEPLPKHLIDALFEAARWAPSSFNEQPWLFLYAVTDEDRSRFSATLNENNQKWASLAPLLIYIAARRRFRENNQENHHRRFDAGAAWMSLALQARRLGLFAHAMAGFKRAEAYMMLKLPEEDYDLIAAIAVGYHGNPNDLSAFHKTHEHPNERISLSKFCHEGSFKSL